MSSSKRIKIIALCVLLAAILAVSFIAAQTLYPQDSIPKGSGNVDSIPYIGIAFAGNTSEQAIAQIDRVKDYTNLYILDSGRNPLSRNQTAVYEVCDYAVANGLSIIVNLGISTAHENDTNKWFWDQNLADIKSNWTERWSEKFLGVYFSDEPGGVQLDGDWTAWFKWYGERLDEMEHPAFDRLNQIYQKMLTYYHSGTQPQDYNLEAEFFIQDILIGGDPGLGRLNKAGITTFTSDYGLYWYDYLGGYDVIFTEFGWNVSVAQQIAQVRGAARLMDKDWGAIVTWKYQGHPFLDTPENIYSQMLSAYQAGAKYIVVFDYSKDGNNTSYALTDDHYNMLEQFWNDIHNNNYADLSDPEAALILPANYGWGMRDHNDTIWGFWETDNKTEQIANVMGTLVTKYGASLDIVYEDSTLPVTKAGYNHIYYWNATGV